MATAQRQKRPRADDLSQDRRPNKKMKSTGELYRNFPPEFWDSLSKVPLTRRSLRELDRRNSTQISPGPGASTVYITDCARFARHGGPDLYHVRGCPEPKGVDRTMASSRAASSLHPKSTKAADISPMITRPISAYDPAFEQCMIDNSIYPVQYGCPDNKPGNLDQLRLEYSNARASLSSSNFPDSAFQTFQKKHNTASETTAVRYVIPIITGGGSGIPNEGHLPFTNIQTISGGATVKAVPDFFDGAESGNIDRAVKDDLSKMIIPTKHASAPVAPNFFLEVKGLNGGAGVVLRQALHDGAIGARAMHALQNYGEEVPGFDGNAYSYSSAYHAGTGVLELYTHHVTPPPAPGRGPEYHMTRVGGFLMTNDRDTFVQGATACRNARDLAQKVRDRFIQAANTRARQPRPETPTEAETRVAVPHQYEESTCEDHVGSQAVGTENYAASQHVDKGPAPTQDLYEEGEEPSQESTSLSAEPTVGFVASFTSNFSAQSQDCSKRNRASHSPPSSPQPHKKQKRASTSTGSAVLRPSATGDHCDL